MKNTSYEFEIKYREHL